MGVLEIASNRYNCKVLCLDKDGLLFDSTAFWTELFLKREMALSRMLNYAGLELWKSLSGVEENGINRTGPFALAYPRDEMVIAASVIYHSTKKTWNSCLQMAVDAFREADQSLDWQRALQPLPGFPDVIEKAKNEGMQIAIVTSDDEERTEHSLAFFNVRYMVDLICTPANVGRGKPYPDMLQYVAKKFGCNTSDLVMVGDSIVDVEMARNARCLGIGIPHPEARHLFNGYLTLDSLLDIKFITTPAE